MVRTHKAHDKLIMQLRAEVLAPIGALLALVPVVAVDHARAVLFFVKRADSTDEENFDGDE